MRILVTGGSGLVGGNLVVEAIRRNLEVIALQRTTLPSRFHGVQSVSVNLEQADEVARAVKDLRPDLVIHCAAILDEWVLRFNAQKAWRTMVDATAAIYRSCRSIGSHFVFVSSDWVFPGEGGPYREEDPVGPVNAYGFLKASAELILAADNFASCTVARTGGVYGIHPTRDEEPLPRWDAGYGGFPRWVQSRLSRGHAVIVDPDAAQTQVNRLANPTFAPDLANALLDLGIRRTDGIFHVCGMQSVDRFGYARMVAEIFDLPMELVKLGRECDLPHWFRVPKNTWLDTTRAVSCLGYPLPGVSERLPTFRRQLEERSA